MFAFTKAQTRQTLTNPIQLAASKVYFIAPGRGLFGEMLLGLASFHDQTLLTCFFLVPTPRLQKVEQTDPAGWEAFTKKTNVPPSRDGVGGAVRVGVGLSCEGRGAANLIDGSWKWLKQAFMDGLNRRFGWLKPPSNSSLRGSNHLHYMSEHGSAKVRGSLFLVRGGLWLLEKNQRKTLHSMHRGGAGTILHEDVDPIQGTLEKYCIWIWYL